MKVFAEHNKIQDYLKQHPMKDITVTEDPKEAHYIITGRYDESKYHKDLLGIIIPYTGHNGIDLEAMRAKNLMLFITPTRSKYVAEKALTLSLALLGKTVYYHNQLTQGNWSARNSEERVPWVSIQHLKVGFFGYGRIGKITHKLMSSLGCTFYTIDRHKTYPSDIHLVENLESLIKTSDIIIISTPLNSTTKGIFDKGKFALMKDKYLVNVGRGKICNEQDLYEALYNKNLKGYASDVWFEYPKGKSNQYPSNYPVHKFDNVVLSNHSGGFTINTNEEVNQDICKTLQKLRDNNYEDQLDLKHLI